MMKLEQSAHITLNGFHCQETVRIVATYFMFDKVLFDNQLRIELNLFERVVDVFVVVVECCAFKFGQCTY